MEAVHHPREAYTRKRKALFYVCVRKVEEKREVSVMCFMCIVLRCRCCGQFPTQTLYPVHNAPARQC